MCQQWSGDWPYVANFRPTPLGFLHIMVYLQGLLKILIAFYFIFFIPLNKKFT